MNFELNEYHRNLSNEELLLDVVKTAERLLKDTLTAEDYRKHGKYHSSTLIRRFGSWKRVLELSQLKTQGHNFKVYFSDDEVITDMKRVADIYNKKAITEKEYDIYGKFSASTLKKRYGGWNSLLKLAGMDIILNRKISNEELFNEIERIWILLGRQPTTTDIKNGISKFSLQSYARRFGSWRGALQAFVIYIDNNSDENFIETSKADMQNSTISKVGNLDTYSHKTKRDINLRLRFVVMKRDNFKCCMCGSSPAKDSSVELQVDHIIPWSKGGETTIENLQTLCKKCNLGKSDLQ